MSSHCFPTTQWTKIIGVIQNGDEQAACDALAEFCGQYRPAIVHFFLRRGLTHDQAEDYTQTFFLKRVFHKWEGQSGFLHNARPDGERKFRSFLCRVLWCFLKDQWKTERSGKAGGDCPHIPLDEMSPSETGDASEYESFGREFDRVFALEIIQRAAARSKHSRYLEAHLRGELSQQAAAQEMGISENAFKQAYHRFRERLARNLWEEVSKLAGPDEEEIRGEIAYLMSLFSGAA